MLFFRLNLKGYTLCAMGFGAKDPSVVSMGAKLLRVLAANVIFSVILHVIMTYYQATERKVLSIFISASIDSMDTT